jgi:hypothetical protein
LWQVIFVLFHGHTQDPTSPPLSEHIMDTRKVWLDHTIHHPYWKRAGN